MPRKTWLMKSEPHKYSWDAFVAEGQTPWDGVRNYQARNNMMAMSVGDLVFYYHSVKGKEIVGLAEVIAEHDQDPTTDDERWRCVTIAPVCPAKTPLTLKAIKADPALAEVALIKQSRLSVMPIAEAHAKRIFKLTGMKAPAKKAAKPKATKKKPAAKKAPAAVKKRVSSGPAPKAPRAWLVYPSAPNPTWGKLSGSIAATWTVGEDKRARRSLRAMEPWDLVFIVGPVRGQTKSKVAGLAQVSRINDREDDEGEPRVLLSPVARPKKAATFEAIAKDADLKDLAPVGAGEATVKRLKKGQVEALLSKLGLALPIKRKPLLTGPWPEDLARETAAKKTKSAAKKPAKKKVAKAKKPARKKPAKG